MTPKTFNRDFNQPKGETRKFAHVWWSFGTPSTPAPSPSVSLRDYSSAGEGAGLLECETKCNVGEREVKKKDEQQHRGKPPALPLAGQVLSAGFSTPFPVGGSRFTGPIFMSPAPSGQGKPTPTQLNISRRCPMDERRSGDRRTESRNRLLTEHEVAGMAGVSINTIRYWRQTGVLPSVKVGKHPRVWLSVFLEVFQKPGLTSPLASLKAAGKMLSVGDVRRGK
jgi:hypothetical protein